MTRATADLIDLDETLPTCDLPFRDLGGRVRFSGSIQGQADVPVGFGGAVFAPGHHLYADENGIVVSRGPIP